MPKPTSPQPPETLSDEECERLAAQIGYGTTPDDCAMIRLGWEARGKRDADLLTRLLKWTSPPGDWACIKCRPQSDMIKAGFLCAWHEAESDIAAIESSSSEPPKNPADDPNVRIEDIRGE